MKKRLITAIILLAIFIPLIIIGGIYFEIALALISSLAFKELLDLISKEKKIPLLIKVLSYITVVILTLFSSFNNIFNSSINHAFYQKNSSTCWGN